jgi:NADH-quinone oxidoreductase subunit G
LAEKITQATGMKLGTLSEGANAAGGWLTGMIPHRGPAGMLTGGIGANTLEMLENKLKSYLLLNVEPELDFIKGNQAFQELSQAEFVVVLSPFMTEAQEQYADVLLPIAPFFETSGSFINACNNWQSFEAVTKPLGNSKPAWKIFRVLGNLFHLEGFDFVDVAQVRSELKKILHTVPRTSYHLDTSKVHYQEPQEGLLRLIEWPMYHIDNIVRRAISLQEWSLDENLLGARINENVAKQFNLKSGELISVIQNEDQLDIPVFIDNRIAGDYVFLAGGLAATNGFGEHMGPIKLLRGRADVE